MHRFRASLLVTVVAATMMAAPAFAAPGGVPGRPGDTPGARPEAAVCGTPAPGAVRCHAHVLVTDDGVTPKATSAPAGYGPASLQSVYGVSQPSSSTWSWNGHTVAIVDAYDDPNAEGDLAVYRSTYGLPPCTTANTCFKKVNQAGGSSMPRADSGWSQEISLDLDMASAMCPGCKILLVEGSSATFGNLATAVNTAAAMGATAISNSYGAGEFSGETTYDSAYNHPGIAVTVSSGDSGYGVQYPAASPYVVAVGGTRLTSNSGVWTETAWSGAGSGCSAFEPKPTAWQTDSGCSRRTVADVSAVADPNTGVAVYDSYASRGAKGWMVFGGTSVAAPIVASVYALAGNVPSGTNAASMPYGNSSALHDVTSGSNGSCGGSYLCTAKVGYDGPTGLGTPNGLAAF